MSECAPALQSLSEIRKQIGAKQLAVFLDYDGTLTPIVDTPEKAVLSEEMRNTVRNLAKLCTVAVISGRDLRDVQKLVNIDEIVYAGSHGFDIAGPRGRHMEYQQGTDFLETLDVVERELRERLDSISGTLVERKKFSIAVHYRLTEENKLDLLKQIVDDILAKHPELRMSPGKKVYDLQPDIDWHKGKALLWLLEALNLKNTDLLSIYIGDDVTDEDAFKVLKDDGIGIVVTDSPRPTEARYQLADPAEVKEFLEEIASIAKGDVND